MNGFIKTGIALTLVAFIMFVAVLSGTVMGWFAGWVVGLFFSDMLLPIFTAIGLKGFTLAHLGAFFGFVGGFFKAHQTNKNNSE